MANFVIDSCDTFALYKAHRHIAACSLDFIIDKFGGGYVRYNDTSRIKNGNYSVICPVWFFATDYLTHSYMYFINCK